MKCTSAPMSQTLKQNNPKENVIQSAASYIQTQPNSPCAKILAKQTKPAALLLVQTLPTA
eukprot:1136828-Pelagomonas_calceolata.AAC.2